MWCKKDGGEGELPFMRKSAVIKREEENRKKKRMTKKRRRRKGEAHQRGRV